jgi:hypothetical protein
VTVCSTVGCDRQGPKRAITGSRLHTPARIDRWGLNGSRSVVFSTRAATKRRGQWSSASFGTPVVLACGLSQAFACASFHVGRFARNKLNLTSIDPGAYRLNHAPRVPCLS